MFLIGGHVYKTIALQIIILSYLCHSTYFCHQHHSDSNWKKLGEHQENAAIKIDRVISIKESFWLCGWSLSAHSSNTESASSSHGLHSLNSAILSQLNASLDG